ncbi:hypothetical protein F5884DRAFT_760673 [Xylogone sp. PMI_703]|nr:hypothetical protein F5884DRAFT_760673 [Xylogone sp. PMI_703]
MNTTGSRRPHRKTRTGCKTCKRRKVKCDEQRPQCSNCIKHSVQCDYLLPPLSSLPGTPITNLSHGAHSPFVDTPQLAASELRDSTSPYDDMPGAGIERRALNLNLADLELLHNYSTSTCYSLSSNPILRTLWKINVPQLGFAYGFVMRGILALSALHLAYFRRERRDYYVSQAILHHQSGLRVAISLLPHINAENCTAVYLFSAMTFIFALANPRTSDEFFLVSEHGMPEWPSLLQGTKSIIQSSYHILHSGSLGPMFEAGRRRVEIRDQTVIEWQHLGEIRKLLISTVADQRLLDVYIAAAEELERSFVAFFNRDLEDFEGTDIFVWLFRSSEEYLSLLKNKAQEALSLFAYSCVLLRKLEKHWWMEGWSTHMLEWIYYSLDKEHRLWIQWPIEEIGWVPDQDGVNHTI